MKSILNIYVHFFCYLNFIIIYRFFLINFLILNLYHYKILILKHFIIQDCHFSILNHLIFFDFFVFQCQFLLKTIN